MKNKFWNWVRNDTDDEEQVLRLNGTIAEESWFDDDVTPALFKSELDRHEGDITVWINSPGGDVFAASQIYTMLMDHRGKVTVKIDGIAASAASVIAMAGGEVLMSPSSMLMIHNPMTMAFGWKDEMDRTKRVLEEVKESIVNAYELKTGLSRSKISKLMDEETWMNAKKAKALHFCDQILFKDDEADESDDDGEMFQARLCARKLVAQIVDQQNPNKTTHSELMKRLELMSH